LIVSWAATVLVATIHAPPGPAEQAAVQRLARQLSVELKQACPLSDAAKWSAYENANAWILWVSPTARPEIRVAQFTWQDGPLKSVEVQRVATPKFDGRWLWTDDAGKTQPAVTLFDGLYSDRNPHKAELDLRVRELATSLREGQCLDCHVPSNPQGLKRSGRARPPRARCWPRSAGRPNRGWRPVRPRHLEDAHRAQSGP
jgi:hypothetical protein